MDRVSLNPDSRQPQRRCTVRGWLFSRMLEEMIALAEFLAERLPRLVDEWQAHRDELRASGRLSGAGADSREQPHQVPSRTTRDHRHQEEVADDV